jgi:hypothetical protein
LASVSGLVRADVVKTLGDRPGVETQGEQPTDDRGRLVLEVDVAAIAFWLILGAGVSSPGMVVV